MKKTEKILKAIAKQLPIYTEPCFTTHLQKGHQLSDAQKEKMAEIPIVDQEKYYATKLTSKIEVNHERRLRRSYERQGKAGIMHYIKAFVKPEGLLVLEAQLNRAGL